MFLKFKTRISQSPCVDIKQLNREKHISVVTAQKPRLWKICGASSGSNEWPPISSVSSCDNVRSGSSQHLMNHLGIIYLLCDCTSQPTTATTHTRDKLIIIHMGEIHRFICMGFSITMAFKLNCLHIAYVNRTFIFRAKFTFSPSCRGI